MYLLFNVLPSFHFSLSHTHTISLSLSYAHTHTHTHTPPSLPFAGHDGVVFDAVWTKQFVVRCVISKPRSLFVFGSSQLCSQLPCHEDLMGLSCNIPPPPFFFFPYQLTPLCYSTILSIVHPTTQRCAYGNLLTMPGLMHLPPRLFHRLQTRLHLHPQSQRAPFRQDISETWKDVKNAERDDGAMEYSIRTLNWKEMLCTYFQI